MSKYSKTRNELAESRVDYPKFAHDDLQYWCSDWELLRDTFNGERDMKEARETYLPKPSGMDYDEYNAYLDRTSYFNMTGRTVSALVGTLFKRAPVINNWPDKFLPALSRVSKDSQSLLSFMKTVVQEQFAVGRFGVLVDMDTAAEGKPKNEPYFAGYIAENIIDWDTAAFDGRVHVISVVLRETRTEYIQSEGRKTYQTFRHLHLVPNPKTSEPMYVQDLYVGAKGDALFDPNKDDVTRYIPTKRGKPFGKIPFVFFGPFTNGSGIEKPPILDIARLNVSHYRSSAQLEHGRFYTGNPIYYAQTDGTERGNYTIGAGVVWEVGPGEKPGIVEFNGQGLKFLENAQRDKEAQISSLGGRMIGIQTQAVSESDNQVNMKEKNERSLLLNVSHVIDDGFAKLLSFWLDWMDGSKTDIDKISVETNKDFMLDNIGAREMRAVQSLYADGHIPIQVLYNNLRAGEVIPDYMQLEEFQALLEDPKNFPNQPDAEARDRGFPDKKTELEQNRADKDAAQAKELAQNADAQALRAMAAQGDDDEDEEDENLDKKVEPAVKPKAKPKKPPKK